MREINYCLESRDPHASLQFELMLQEALGYNGSFYATHFGLSMPIPKLQDK